MNASTSKRKWLLLFSAPSVVLCIIQGVTKGCRWLTNSYLIYAPKCGGGLQGPASEYSCAHGAQINFGDLNSIFNLLYHLMELAGGEENWDESVSVYP
jgi:hypothetical protein